MKFKVLYSMQGEIEVEAEDMEKALENFEKGEGFTAEDLYMNLEHEANAFMVKKS